MTQSSAERTLARLTEIALELPEAQCTIQGQHASFTVRKRTFAYYLKNHHGDGVIALACKALRGDNICLAQQQPDRFYLPAYIGPRGWVALRLDRGPVDFQEVRDLLITSYQQVAPKRLSKLISTIDDERP